MTRIRRSRRKTRSRRRRCDEIAAANVPVTTRLFSGSLARVIVQHAEETARPIAGVSPGPGNFTHPSFRAGATLARIPRGEPLFAHVAAKLLEDR